MRFFLFAILVITSYLARADEAPKVSDDFFVTHESGSGARESQRRNDSCKHAIRASVCLVDPPQDGQIPLERKCLSSDFDYAKPFEGLYDRLPRHLQKMFCHLSRIFIEKDYKGSAYGSLFENENGQITGGMLGIRAELLTDPVTLDGWASWKEQIHFGTDPSHVNTVPDLPQVRTSMADSPTDMLYFLVAHEFAHMFDFTNQLNHSHNCKDRAGRHDCDRPSWDLFSWSGGAPLPEDDFPLRPALCYYFCEGHFIAPGRQDELYTNLQKTNFLTPYATRFASEDFADTFALYTIATERNATYRIETPNLRYDVISRLWLPPLFTKRNFIRDFLASNYLYPGEISPAR